MSRNLATRAILGFFLLAGCFFNKPSAPWKPASSIAELDKLTEQPHEPTGTIPAAELDKMNASGVARFETRFLHVRSHNHLDSPLAKVVLRCVVSRSEGKVRKDETHMRKLLAAPHSDFQVTIRLGRQPRPNEVWSWALVDGTEGNEPR
ncbi:hypothetical protein CMO84_02260 [Candidatus Woesearchaeota archaeon]|jgi:hypothetical protein|nr:hypothetical protein [Candidatus Woesearchaeota archaeon]MDP6939681.1 hypothetical protein [Planctomycetota bacterium]